MKVYGVPPSPFTRKVLVVLEEKKIPYEFEQFAPFPKRPELTEKHPMGLIPILEHNGSFIRDSSVICAYIERYSPSIPMYPTAPAAYAHTLFMEEYADTAVATAIAPIFRERFIKPNVFGELADDAIVESAKNETLPSVFDFLESQLEDGSLIGDTFSVADAALGNVLTSLNLSNEPINGALWPKLLAYHNVLLKRPSFRTVFPME